MASILIVDDEGPIRRILSVLLQERRHRVSEAASGRRRSPWGEIGGGEAGPRAARPQAPRHRRAGDPQAAARPGAAAGRGDDDRPRQHLLGGGGDAPGRLDYLTKPFDNDELLILARPRAGDAAAERRGRVAARGDRGRYGFSEIVGISREIQDVFRLMAKVGGWTSTVLVTRRVGHRQGAGGPRASTAAARARGRPVRGGQLRAPSRETLIETRALRPREGGLHRRRARRRPGTFEQADGGTLFLDEIGELPLDAQAKLLRALQERQIQRVGRHAARRSTCASSPPPTRTCAKEVGQGRFREDLYYRLNVVHDPRCRRCASGGPTCRC